MDSLESTNVVFPPWKRYLTILGIKATNLPKIAIVVAIAALLVFVGGFFTIETQESLTNLEKNSALTELQRQQDAIKTVENHFKDIEIAEGERDVEVKNYVNSLNSETQKNYELALNNHITASMDDSQLEALIPTTKTVVTERFGIIPRLFVCFVLPVVLAVIWNLDLKGFSFSSEFQRIRKFKSRQTFYIAKGNYYTGLAQIAKENKNCSI